MAERMRIWFTEVRVPYTLFVLSVAAHLVFFYGLMFFYGPCAFFLSSDCSTTNNDTQHYVVIADNLSHGNGYSRFSDPPYEPDALRTPLLPLYFAPFAYLGGLQLIWLAMAVLNILLSLAPVFAYKLARLFLPHAYALAAGLFLALEPLFLYRSQIAEPDALLVLITLAAAYFLVSSWRERSLQQLCICAALLGAGILAKPSAQYIALIFLVFELVFLAFISGAGRRERVMRIAAMFGITLLVVFPWVARNKQVFGVVSVSSIQGYNLYEYHTKGLKIDGDEIPQDLYFWSREPSRYLPFQQNFTHVAVERIKQHPAEFAKDMATGALRNLFVSDISAIYYYGHTKLLPFPYNPESRVNVGERLQSGDVSGAIFDSGTLLKILWILILGVVYWLAVAGWFLSWKRDSLVFLAFTLFAVVYGYLIASSGLYVDAKYRLPGMGLLVSAALYGFWRLREGSGALRSGGK